MNPLLVAIGTSAGGVEALKTLLPSFKRPSRLSVLVVLHFPPEGPNLLPSLFQDICDFSIKEADAGERLLPETIYVAAPDYHLSAENNGTLSLSTEAPVNFSRPSIDILFESVAVSYGERGIGILLTGANHDGAEGLKSMKEHGAITIVQDPLDADYPTMPESALKIMKPDHILTLARMTDFLDQLSGVNYE